jgi:hypothetical protein
MLNESWIDELNMLLARYSYLNLNADIATLSLVELWGLYCYLSRLAGE